ncbi:MAG: glycosyltransferase [Cyclobacteriaceae bacterium]|nr:glycosyltransferase [Cyclobacteriaceae bacterium]
MNVLYIGDLWEGSTALQRLTAFQELANCVAIDSTPQLSSDLKRSIHRISVRLKLYYTFSGVNRKIVDAIENKHFDLVWIDKGLSINKSTLKRIKELQPDSIIVSYSPDDMFNPANQSLSYIKSIPLFDLHVTTKSYNVSELKSLGASSVFFIGNAFDPQIHKSLNMDKTDVERLGADVSFIGSWERERFEYILFLAENGISVKVWGADWAKYANRNLNLKVVPAGAWYLEYAKVLNASKINLCFLKKGNRDLQTTRSIEIPASGGFMLAERTNEHLELFREDYEAAYFSSKEEMLKKVNFYLTNSEERQRIAAAGQKRCVTSGYSNKSRLIEVLKHLQLEKDLLVQSNLSHNESII